MSRYWNNHIEELEGLERDAAVRWVSGVMAEVDDETKVDDEVTLPALMDALQAEHPKAFRAIMDAGAYRLVDFSRDGVGVI